MALSPALHPLNVFRSAKVRTIFRLVEPLGLGSGLAGLATLGFRAVALSVSTIRAGNKELSAMEALARRRRVHGGATTQPHRQDVLLFGAAAWRCAARDRYLNWSESEHLVGLQRIANNSRFLILPHVLV